jgi:hypothetical protein
MVLMLLAVANATLLRRQSLHREEANGVVKVGAVTSLILSGGAADLWPDDRGRVALCPPQASTMKSDAVSARPGSSWAICSIPPGSLPLLS